MTLSSVELYTDGSALRNPGMGGYGFIIRYTEDDPNNDAVPVFKDIEMNQGYRYTTNNRMEIMAALYGIKHTMEKIKDGTIKGCTQLNVFSDSEYLCKPINNRWIDKWIENNWMTSGFGGKAPQPIKNKDLWEQIIDVRNQIREMNISLVFNWVKGHDSNEMNNRADKLAVAASTGNNYLVDEVFEQLSKISK